MRLAKNAASSLLLVAGVGLTFVGLSSALGFTPGGMLASVGAIAALLYAGGVWLGRPPVPAPAAPGGIIVFDRSLRVASGPALGSPVAAQFPSAIRSIVDSHCLSALMGEASHFVCEDSAVRFVLEAAPVRDGAGVVLFGVLIVGSGAAAAVTSSATAPVASQPSAQ
jgi:hypothetical protein